MRLRVYLLWMLVATGPVAARPIDCSKAVSIAEKAVCASPNALALDAEIDARYAALRETCGPRARRVLVAGQRYWLRERNDCANAPSPYEQTKAECVENRLHERAQFLRNVPRCEVAHLATRYRFVDPWYLHDHGRAFIDFPVSVFGVLKPRACDRRQRDSLDAWLADPRRPEARVAVRLRSLPDDQRQFLCARDIASHWDGTVRRAGAGIVLHVDDILGVPLP